MVTIDIEIGVIQSAFKRCRGMMGNSGVGGDPRLSSQEAE